QAGGSDNDAVATATALTAETIARGLERWTPGAGPETELVISGGGARNPVLVEMLAARVHPRPVQPFDRLFFDGEAKEALVFAFLGFLTISGLPGNLPAATGARGRRVLGHITPACTTRSPGSFSPRSAGDASASTTSRPRSTRRSPPAPLRSSSSAGPARR